MNYSEFSLYGMCPFYDQTLLVRCHICQLIVKLPQLAEHLLKRHDISEADQLDQAKSGFYEISKLEPLDGNGSKNGNRKNLKSKLNENEENNGQNDSTKLKYVVEKIKTKLNNKTTTNSFSLVNEIEMSTNCLATKSASKQIDSSLSSLINNTNEELMSNSNLDLDLNSLNLSLNLQQQQPLTPNKTKITSSKSSKIYDPDKHCGVFIESFDESTGEKVLKDRCLRSLTCKKHSINLRRQVAGRSKSFNELFKECRKEKPSTSPNPPKTPPPPPILQSPILSFPTEKSIKRKQSKKQEPQILTSIEPLLIEEPTPSTNHLINDPPYISNLNLNSTITSFTEPISNTQFHSQEKQQKLNLNNLNIQFVKHHPRPSGVTSFNARLTDNGGGFTLWNRKQDNLRLVLAKTFKNPQKVCQEEFLIPSSVNLKRSFPCQFIKTSNDTIQKLNDYLIDGDIFQDDDEDDQQDTSKYIKLNNSEQGTPSSSYSASSSSNNYQKSLLN